MLSLSISTAGVWSCPATTGERPPPCAAFTFTAVDDSRAVLFGGRSGDQGVVNDVYIIDLLTMVRTHDTLARVLACLVHVFLYVLVFHLFNTCIFTYVHVHGSETNWYKAFAFSTRHYHSGISLEPRVRLS